MCALYGAAGGMFSDSDSAALCSDQFGALRGASCRSASGALYGGVSVLIYLLLAAVGVPVLAGFRGGLGALMGSTGGYVVGYIFAAVIAGVGSRYWGDRFWKLCVSMTVGFVVCYVFGTIWYMILSGNSLAVSLSYCVWPFIPGDIVKVLLAALLTLRLRKPLAAILQ